MSSKPTMSFQEWSQEIARHKRTLRYKPETLRKYTITKLDNEKEPDILYISTACYGDNTKRMFDELKERLDKRSSVASQWKIIDNPFSITDWVKNNVIKYSQADIDATMQALNYYDEIKKQQEETKMEAKKCERCGKLYEMQDVENYITAYFPGLSVSDYSKENYSESRIRKDNTRIVSVNSRSGQVVDLCPECREKLKNFFESGKDETTVIKKAEE